MRLAHKQHKHLFSTEQKDMQAQFEHILKFLKDIMTRIAGMHSNLSTSTQDECRLFALQSLMYFTNSN